MEFTSSQSRINPSLTGFNIGCIDEVNQFDLNNINIADGENHPLDKK